MHTKNATLLIKNTMSIEVRLGPYKKGEKAYLTPNVYTIHNVFQEIERMKKYYYDKKK